MKWILIFIWLFSIVFFYFRGKIRPSFSKTFIDHSIVLAPINLLFVLTSKVQKTPFIPLENLPELQSLTKNWEIFRDEASILLASHNMIEVERLCSSVFMMKNGVIIDQDSPVELIKKHGRKNLEEVFLKLTREKYES